jgi:hypothetical protein
MKWVVLALFAVVVAYLAIDRQRYNATGGT